MSSILRALRSLPIYVVTGKTRYNEFHPDACVPVQDTGTRNDSLNAGGALGVTQITDITGLVAWKDYIPVQNEAGRTVPYSYDANGYFPIKVASGAIFSAPDTWDPANVGTNVTLSNGNLTANVTRDSQCALSAGTRSTTDKLYVEYLVGTQTNLFGFIGFTKSDQGRNAAISTTATTQRGSGAWGQAGGVNGSAWAAGDVIGFAITRSTGAVLCYKNNVANGSITVAALANQAIKCVATQTWGAGLNFIFTLRTDVSEFSYSPPTGYTPWAEGT